MSDSPVRRWDGPISVGSREGAMLQDMIAAVFLSGLACGQETRVEAASSARKAVERSLEFMEKDALRWKNEKNPKKGGCATCHHGSLTVWALSEAEIQGFKG